MAYSTVATTAADATFAASVKAAMVHVAYDAATDQTVNVDRTAFGVAILRSPDLYATAFAFAAAVAKDGLGAAMGTDAQVKTAVLAIFNGMARR